MKINELFESLSAGLCILTGAIQYQADDIIYMISDVPESITDSQIDQLMKMSFDNVTNTDDYYTTHGQALIIFRGCKHHHKVCTWKEFVKKISSQRGDLD